MTEQEKIIDRAKGFLLELRHRYPSLPKEHESWEFEDKQFCYEFMRPGKRLSLFFGADEEWIFTAMKGDKLTQSGGGLRNASLGVQQFLEGD